MPTTATKTVKPSGGDYTSLSAWEAAQQGDIVTADEIRQAECYSMQDTTAVTISGWTTDATRYIRIYTPAAERHAGVWDETKYFLTGDNASAITVGEEYVRLEGLQLRVVGTINNNRFTVYWTGGNVTSDIRISASIIRGHTTATYRAYGIECSSYNFTIWNCLLYDFSTNANSAGIVVSAAGVTNKNLYNNTIIVPSGITAGVRVAHANATVVSKNNLVQSGSTTAFLVSAGSLTNTNCASGDGTADDFGGSGNRVNQTFTFVNAGASDYHLANSDAGAKDFGVSDPGSGLFSDDIDGQTRTGSWDIGADEVLAAVTPIGKHLPHNFPHNFPQIVQF